MSAIDKAIHDLTEQRDRIDAALRVLRELSGGGSPAATGHSISAAGRRRIAAAQKRRWARVRAANHKKK